MTENDIRQKEEEISSEKKRLRKEEQQIKDFQIEQRTETLKRLYDLFINQYETDVQDAVYLNHVLLYSAVHSYYDDIYRFKDYSCSKWADNHKQAGYIVKWITKFRPVQIKSNDVIVTDLVLTINAAFALFVGCSFLDLKILKEMTTKYYSHLIYCLLYRNLSGKQLASLFYVLEAAVNGKKP